MPGKVYVHVGIGRVFHKVAETHVHVGEPQLQPCAVRGGIQQNHIGALLAKCHLDFFRFLAGEACILCHGLGLQGVAVLVQQDGQQGALIGLGLEAVILQGHVRCGDGAAVVQGRVQRGLLSCAGIGAGELDAGAVVALGVFRHGLAVLFHKGVGVEVHAAGGDLLLLQGAGHIARQVIGDQQSHAALVQAA